jgi:hypothetical protein
MNAASYIFFGLLLVPLIIFIIWLIKKDKTRNYLGLIVLVIMIFVALFAILKYDINFMNTGEGSSLKSQTPSYR